MRITANHHEHANRPGRIGHAPTSMRGSASNLLTYELAPYRIASPVPAY